MKRITTAGFAAAAMLGASLTCGGMAVAQEAEVESDVFGQPRLDVEDRDAAADRDEEDAEFEQRAEAEADLQTVVESRDGELRIRGREGQVESRRLDDDVAVMIDGQEGEFADIRQGDRVRFVTGPDDSVQRVIVVRDAQVRPGQAARPGQEGTPQREGAFLGVQISESPTTGVYVRDVMEGGPADQGGIQARDYILSVDGEKVGSPQEFDQKLSQLKVGSQAKFEIWRNEQKQQVTVNLAEQQPGAGVARQGQQQNRNLAQQQNRFDGSQDRSAAFRPEDDQRQPQAAGEARGQAWLGVQLQDAAPAREGQPQDQREGVQPQDQREGVRVSNIYPSGPAARYGLREGDMIVRIADQEVASADEAARLIGQQQPGETVSLVVIRGEEEQPVEVVLGNRSDFFFQDSRSENDRFGGQQHQQQQQGRANFGGDFQGTAHVPEHAMMLEQHRRFAEQHERMERMLVELKQEVQQLRQELRNGGRQESGQEEPGQQPPQR